MKNRITLNDVTCVVTAIRWVPFSLTSYLLSDGKIGYLSEAEARKVFGDRQLREAQRRPNQWMEL